MGQTIIFVSIANGWLRALRHAPGGVPERSHTIRRPLVSVLTGDDMTARIAWGMAYPSPDPWHRRYWNTYNRPYGGCGCLYSILIILVLWWVLSWFWPGAYFWR